MTPAAPRGSSASKGWLESQRPSWATSTYAGGPQDASHALVADPVSSLACIGSAMARPRSRRRGCCGTVSMLF